MKIAVYAPPTIPTSFVVYLERVSTALEARGASFVRFASEAGLPDGCSLLWDIRSGGGNPPPEFLLGPGLPPLVVTIHGFAPMSLPAREYYRTWQARLQSTGYRRRQQRRWRAVQDRIAQVIAVSAFTRSEIATHTGIRSDRIVVCPHGVEAATFEAAAAPSAAAETPLRLLHVSNDEPRKNVGRIVDAFALLRRRVPDAELVLKLPADAARRYGGLPGVRIVAGHLPDAALAELYASASAFVFPSLYEGFGMPILEAMSAGCPVITSSVSACPEVAGDAALIVDPRDVAALAEAMFCLAVDAGVRQRCIERGRQRASAFTWERSAQAHYGAFEAAIRSR